MTSEVNPNSVRWLAWCTLLAAMIFAAVRLMPMLSKSPESEPRKIDQLAENNWQLAMSALDQGDSGPALEFVRLSIGKPGVKAKRSLLQGRLLLASDKLLAAGQAFREAEASPELKSLALFWLGATAYRGGNTVVAENYWLRSLESDANNLEAHRSLSMFYYDVGAIDNAVAHLQRSTELNAVDARPYRLLGLIYSDYERYEEAIGFYRSALDRKLTIQTRDQVLRELTGCYLKTRDYQKGLETIGKASETLDAIALKADCLVGLGEQQRAIELLDEVLEKDPLHFGGLMSMGDAQLVNGNAIAAVEFLNRAVAINSKDYLANYKLAQALRAVGQAEEAEKVAALAESIKGTRERFTQLHKDATSNPRDAEIRYQLGITAEELGMTEMALVWYKAALQLNPAHAAAQAKLSSPR